MGNMLANNSLLDYTGDNFKKGADEMAPPIKNQLRTIRIKGFKSIKEQEINFNRVNILIGSNGAGKSNLISAFTLLEEIIKKRLGVYSAQRGADAFCTVVGNKHQVFLWSLFLEMKIPMGLSLLLRMMVG